MIDYVKHPAPAPVRIATLEELAGDAILAALDLTFALGQASALGASEYTEANTAAVDAVTEMWRAFYALTQPNI